MNERYNPKRLSLVSTPVLSAVTWTAAGVAVLGTDDWLPALNTWGGATGNRAGVFYNGVNSGISSGKVNCIFSPNERVLFERLTLHCNFADGLVDISDITITPAGIAGNPTPSIPFSPFSTTDFALNNAIFMSVQVNRIKQDNSVEPATQGQFAKGSWRVPIPGFNIPVELTTFDNRMEDMGANPTSSPFTDTNQPNPNNADYQALAGDKGYYLSGYMGMAGQPKFSTLSINPLFQTKRVLIWAVLDAAVTNRVSFAGGAGVN